MTIIKRGTPQPSPVQSQSHVTIEVPLDPEPHPVWMLLFNYHVAAQAPFGDRPLAMNGRIYFTMPVAEGEEGLRRRMGIIDATLDALNQAVESARAASNAEDNARRELLAKASEL
ncbi:hypothetical protein [Sandaracinus amylolyticus]|nr:hypothetical protein [Sandaracinus amylolyticus]